jgi:hypothetical protein
MLPEEAIMKKSSLLQQPALAVRVAGAEPKVAAPCISAEVVEMFKRIGLSKEFTAAKSLKRYDSVPVQE